MTFCTKGARLKQRLLEPYALIIDVLPCFHVIYSVYHQIQIVPESVVENILFLGAHSQRVSAEFSLGIHRIPYLTGSLAFAQPNMVSPE